MIHLAESSRRGFIAHAIRLCRGKFKAKCGLAQAGPRLMEDLRSEQLLVAAARALVAALREPLERGQLPVASVASLRRLEMVLEGYPPPVRLGS
jgi:hypothetical protein